MKGRLGVVTLALCALAFAAAAGLGSAYWAIRAGPRFDQIAIGPWIAEPDSGAVGADPYALARRVRLGVIAPLAFESVAFFATADSGGNSLEGRCDYRIEGPAPPARTWTLTVLMEDGAPVRGERRRGFTAAEIVRLDGADVAIVASARARPGNWLPVPEERFQLALRLYDTAVASGFGASQVAFPRIVRGQCR